MTSKRTATTELNHDNWNEEQEPEEAGTFVRASNDVLRSRVVKTARRGSRVSPTEESSAKSAFEGFTGFGTPPAKSAPFSFLAGASTNLTANTTSTTTTVNTSKNIASNGATKVAENDANKTEESAKAQTTSNIGTGNKQASADQTVKKAKNTSSDYYTRLKGLNESVAQWIKSHVDSNPFCILTPIFKDYERYLKGIVAKETKAQTTTHKAERTTKAAQNDNKKDESSEKKQSPESMFGGNANITTKSSALAGAEWKPEKSVFSNITPTTKSIFGNTEQKTEGSKSMFGNTDPTATSEARRPIFGLESNASSKSIFSNISAENNPFLQKPPVASDSKAEEEPAKSEAKPAAPTFPSSTFSFGQGSTTSNVTAGFSFGGMKNRGSVSLSGELRECKLLTEMMRSGKPFTFASCPIKPQEQEEKTDNDNKDEDYEEPPKPDFKPVTEEGAVYEQRCKIFVKKDGNFSDRGVGTLFLKPTPNGKTQLIVRADTALGNLLLNTLLTPSIPVKRMNKNTIMLVCLPMPDTPPPPVPVLLRVKTSETADSLFETLDKYTK